MLKEGSLFQTLILLVKSALVVDPELGTESVKKNTILLGGEHTDWVFWKVKIYFTLLNAY